MTSRRAQQGQIIPIVALLMVVIMGIAAFAIDGSNVYSQHRKLQADLDVAVKSAAAKMFNHDPSSSGYASTVTEAITTAAQILAADGYPSTLTTGPVVLSGSCASDNSAGVKFCTPPQRGPFVCTVADPTSCHGYVEG